MDLIGAAAFDPEDSDWACDEVTNFDSRKQVFRWIREAAWDAALEEMLDALNRYLNEGRYAAVLKSRAGVGAGFDDGDLHILYQK